MKISMPFKQKTEQGVALIVTMSFAVLFGTLLGSYLLLVSSDGRTVSRSQTWNSSLAYAEAGVDEALAQVNASPNDFSANSWGGGSGGVYGPVTRTMGNGSYTVTAISGTTAWIYSTGFVNVVGSSQKVSRAILVKAQQLGLFPVAFAAVNGITLNGNGVTSDSYNSHLLGTLSTTNGLYDPTKTSTNGNVASVQGIVDPGNHTINGSLYLGPNATYDGTSANVTGTIYDDYNIQFNPVVVPTPTNGWTQATAVKFTNGVYGVINSGYHFTTSGNYQITSSANVPIVIDAKVNATIWVTASSFDLTTLQIHSGGVLTNSGTANIYLDGPSSVGTAGNGAVDASGRPENLWIYGTDKLTGITFSGNSQFTGVIYALNASITLNGGGNNSLDVAGSVVVNSITVNGHFAMHYDEWLKGLGGRGFIPISWQEL